MDIFIETYTFSANYSSIVKLLFNSLLKKNFLINDLLSIDHNLENISINKLDEKNALIIKELRILSDNILKVDSLFLYYENNIVSSNIISIDLNNITDLDNTFFFDLINVGNIKIVHNNT